ncbi:MAG: S8 family serine peptidase [Williamsia sp.]|nr:S8 family serine peptidase [Williamsia sp.]
MKNGLPPAVQLCAFLLFSLCLSAQKNGLTLLQTPAASQPRLEKGSTSIGRDLQQIYQLRRSAADTAAGLRSLEQTGVAKEQERLLITPDNRVLVNITLAARSKTTKAALEKMGIEITAMYGRTAAGFVPVDLIPQLATQPSLKFVRPAYRSKQQAVVRPNHLGKQAFYEPVISQGDAAQHSDQARSKYKVTGKGVKVGILSDSYNSLNTADIGVLNGELPAVITSEGSRGAVEVLQEGFEYGTDEGRALAEIVHDIAPDAEIAFHTASYGQANFAQGILDLAAFGCNILIDDALYPDEPFFQDGIIAQAINTIHKKGVICFSAAGNNGSLSYESDYRSSDYAPFEANFIHGTAHNFSASGDAPSYFQPINIPRNHLFLASFQWNQSFYSAGGSGAETDMDVFLLDANGTIIRSGFDDNITTGDPVELLNFFNDTPSEQFYIAILKYRGPDPGHLKWVSFGDEIGFYVPSPAPPGLYASGLVGHPNAEGTITVGAANYLYTPAFGINPPQAEFFSSRGGVPQYFDNQGNPVQPVIRNKPDITAPDAGNNSFFSTDSRQDLDEYPNFFGTSAAAAHAGGVAALMIEAQKLRTITPEQIRGILASHAIDMDDINTLDFDKGFDFKTGTGLIQADAAVDAVSFPKIYINDLQAEAVCSDNPGQARNWKVTNPNPFEVKAYWALVGFPQCGTVMMQPGVTSFATQTGYQANSEVSNVLILEWNDNFGFPHLNFIASNKNSCDATILNSTSDQTRSGRAGEVVKPTVAESFPNPFNQSFKVYLSVPGSQQLQLELFTVDGRPIFRRTAAAEGVVNVDASRYKAGMYYLKITGLHFSKTVQLVKMP